MTQIPASALALAFAFAFPDVFQRHFWPRFSLYAWRTLHHLHWFGGANLRFALVSPLPALHLLLFLFVLVLLFLLAQLVVVAVVTTHCVTPVAAPRTRLFFVDFFADFFVVAARIDFVHVFRVWEQERATGWQQEEQLNSRSDSTGCDWFSRDHKCVRGTARKLRLFWRPCAAGRAKPTFRFSRKVYCARFKHQASRAVCRHPTSTNPTQQVMGSNHLAASYVKHL